MGPKKGAEGRTKEVPVEGRAGQEEGQWVKTHEKRPRLQHTCKCPAVGTQQHPAPRLMRLADGPFGKTSTWYQPADHRVEGLADTFAWSAPKTNRRGR